uniref:GKTx n=1 Tax=Centruroides hentzi TaxID=88313 RepID=A0A2I9LP10_9SCOR
MKVLILILIIASVMIMGVEMGRDSCFINTWCLKYGYYQDCTDCCKKAGYNAKSCQLFECKCANMYV